MTTTLDRIRRNARSARVGDCGHPAQLTFRRRRLCVACALALLPKKSRIRIPDEDVRRDQLRRMGDPH